MEACYMHVDLQQKMPYHQTWCNELWNLTNNNVEDCMDEKLVKIGRSHTIRARKLCFITSSTIQLFDEICHRVNNSFIHVCTAILIKSVPLYYMVGLHKYHVLIIFTNRSKCDFLLQYMHYEQGLDPQDHDEPKEFFLRSLETKGACP